MKKGYYYFVFIILRLFSVWKEKKHQGQWRDNNFNQSSFVFQKHEFFKFYFRNISV